VCRIGARDGLQFAAEDKLLTTTSFQSKADGHQQLDHRLFDRCVWLRRRIVVDDVWLGNLPESMSSAARPAELI
jgi:hypothetical protein